MSTPLTIQAALRWPDLDFIDARVLLQHALSVNHAYLIAHSERTLTASEEAQLVDWFKRRVAGEPVAYIVGRREFYGRDFYVSPAVLVPRPETELLVDLALDRLQDVASPRLLDLGTGSGCVAVTVALARRDATVIGVDASAEALSVAERNARNLGAANASFVLGHWFEPIADQTFDVIVANPPYVAEEDPHLSEGDVRFEPKSALVSGSAGLDDLTIIIAAASAQLRRGGWLLLEHGWDQAAEVTRRLSVSGFQDVFTEHDLAGQPRVSGGKL